jgi:hypothetical protein
MTQQALDTRGPDDRASNDPSARETASVPAGPVTLLDGIRSHKLLVVLFGLGFALLAAAFTWLGSSGASTSGQLGLIYPASGNVLLPLPTGDATLARYTSQRALFAKSDEVLTGVVSAVPDVTLQGLRRSILVSPSKTANAIVVTATAESPEQALTIAQAVMDSYRTATAADVNERAEALARGWEARGDTAKAKQVRIDGESFGDGVEFEVSPTLQPTSRFLLNKEVALGLLVGLGFGSVLGWYLEDTRRRRGAKVVGGRS